MKHLTGVCLAVSLLILGFTVAPTPTMAADAVCDPAGEIVDPQPFQWTDAGDHFVGVLEYGEATFTVNNGDTLTTRAYRQEGGCYAIPGPTITMTPGHTYVLRFRNLLPYEAPQDAHNDFKDPNVTNVHTHGLHISGESPSDDVTRMFEGGFGGDYVYDIPADHMGGTYWYHAHHHGSTFLQVSTGGFGLMLIDNAGDGIPANVAAMQERQLLIGYLDTGAAGTGGDQLVSGTLAPGWTVNGAVGGQITTPPDTWEHWRVLLADRDAKMKDVTIGAGCEAKLLARDGVWRTTAPKDLPSNAISLTGASRADLAVRCSTDSDLRVNGEEVATIRTAGTPDPGPHPYAEDGMSTWSADRPAYLRDLRGVGSVHNETIRMGARTVNGSKFDIDVPTLTLTADAVQEWSIRGAANHPFHLHVYHFQPTEACGDFEAGEYYDTIAANCPVRFDLNAATSSPYAGRTIMHCHILEHEDQGAMGWMDVIGGTVSPAFPEGEGYGEYYALAAGAPAAPSALAATAVSSSAIDVAWTDNAADETSFDIERSLDGTTFQPLASVGADVTIHSDTRLDPDTTYWFRVRAGNAAGPSAWSNVASATTLPETGGQGSVAVGSVVVSAVSIGGGFKAGQATVTVVDQLGAPVEGAVVTGDFTGTFDEPGVTSTPTAADGTTVISTSGSAKGKVSVTFCATGITHPELDNWSGSVCASS